MALTIIAIAILLLVIVFAASVGVALYEILRRRRTRDTDPAPPAPLLCTRHPYHAGACNGWPTKTCLRYNGSTPGNDIWDSYGGN